MRSSAALAGTLAQLALALMLSVGCAGFRPGSGDATTERCWPCEAFPEPGLALEIRLTEESLRDPVLRDWLDRLDRLREDLGECWRVQR